MALNEGESVKIAVSYDYSLVAATKSLTVVLSKLVLSSKAVKEVVASAGLSAPDFGASLAKSKLSLKLLNGLTDHFCFKNFNLKRMIKYTTSSKQCSRI